MHSEIKGHQISYSLGIQYQQFKTFTTYQTNWEGVDIVGRGRDVSAVAADRMDAWE